VVQLHDATTRHYDFRLEVEGVLRSWAVPRGPAFDPAQRRLAQPVADHALEHASYEGVLPDARRGTGAVIIWDRGVYTSRDGSAAQALAAGHLAFELEGEKLRGGWALTRVAEGRDERWVLVKVRDDHADRERDLVKERPESVVSGLTVDELAERGA
jgi:DNA ligase D-like protein (predicted 3'-phosphoesterase)